MKKILLGTFLLVLASPVVVLADDLRIICVGDSITAGYAAKGNESYPFQLKPMLTGVESIENLGISGTTMLKKSDAPYWDRKFMPTIPTVDVVVQHQPDIILLMLGSNDAKPHNWVNKAEFEQDYTDMVEKFRAARSHPTVYGMVSIPAFDGGNFNIPPQVLQDEVVPMEKEVMAKLNLPVIDLNAVFQGRGDLIVDKVHPKPEGYKLIAETIAAALKSTPHFPVRNDFFTDSTTVTIDVPTGAQVRYTLDGTLPTLTSPLYDKPIALTQTTVVNAAVVTDGKMGLTASATFTKTAPAPAVTPAGKLVPGLDYSFYERNEKTNIWRLEWDDSLFVGKGEVPDLVFTPRTDTKAFGMEFTGYITVPADGVYTFAVTDDSAVSIGDEVVVENGGHRGFKDRSARIALAAGLHPIKVRFYGVGKDPKLTLSWEGPGLERQVVPATAYSHPSATP